MRKFKTWLFTLAVLLGTCAGLHAQAAGDSPPTGMDPAGLAAKIDRLIEARWAEKGVKQAPVAEDGEFLRRIYLDLTGRIPNVMEVRKFLADKAPDKRSRIIDELLENPRHVTHLSNTWRAMMLPVNNDQQAQFLAPLFKTWLDRQVQGNVPYDQMVRELVSFSLDNSQARPGYGFAPPASNVTPVAFYQASEFKAENLAASTSRVFLGVRLECAQCHDHPFAKWTRKQFWEYAAFFSGIQVQQFNPGRPKANPNPGPRGRKIAIPGTDKIAEARFLDGKAPQWEDGVDSRVTLANWFVSAENPYFAQAAVNRLWGQFFGLGINDPVDDEPTDDNPTSHPELLTELTQQFVAHKFDVKYMIRAITLSKTYQRTSVVSHPSQNEPRLFARMAVKGMSPEQLFDSLALATGFKEPGVVPNQRGLGPNNARTEFLQRFATQDRKTETQTSILQALAMMNGKFIADATSISRSNRLGSMLPSWDNTQRIEVLYLATLTRFPRPAEASRMLEYVNNGGPRNDSSAALADVFWALLNTSEFMLNH